MSTSELARAGAPTASDPAKTPTGTLPWRVLLVLASAKWLGEKLTLKRVIGLIIGCCGVGFIILSRMRGSGGRANTPLGVTLVTLAIVALVGATVSFKKYPPKESLLIFNGIGGLASGVVNTAFMMGGALGLAVLASLAASRTDALTASGSGELAALAGGYHAAFLVGAVFAAAAAAVGVLLLRPASVAAMHGEASDEAAVAEAA